MSVKVDLDQSAGALDGYTFAYLVTVDDGYHAHTVAVEPVLADGVIDVGPVGGGTRKNLAQHDGATLVWPPSQPGGYTLIVDGTGQPTDAATPRFMSCPAARFCTGRQRRTRPRRDPAA